MQEKREETTSTTKKSTARSQGLYKAIWRWHFYAGLVFTPFLLILAVTGGMYLFKPQIEERLYHDLYHVQAQSQSVSPSAQVQAVKEKYSGADVLTYKPSDRSTRSSEVGISLKDHTYTIFVNPHNGHIIGKLDDSSRLMNQIEELYTLSVFSPRAQDEATIHLDQYTGAVLADYRYGNYGFMGKLIALGITLHKGTQFELMNQLMGLIICIGIAGIAISGALLWWKRKPAKNIGAPKVPEGNAMRIVTCIIVVFGILFPLVGLSLVIVWLLDFFVIKQIPALKRFLNA